MKSLKLMPLIFVLMSTNLFAGTSVKVRTNGIGQGGPLVDVYYSISSDKIVLRANGRLPDNRLVYCIVNFPITMKEYAQEIYKTLMTGHNNSNFSFNCTNTNPSNIYGAIVDLSSENPQENFSFEAIGIR